jgi:CDP-diacylglycerol---glycerol-3-phosphate 3-phosphatidyltransferase
LIKSLPNILTLARIVMILVCLLLATIAQDYKVLNHPIRMIAYILAFLAGWTDILDGYIARKFNVTSDFGALIDPLADKIFLVAVSLVLVAGGQIPAWVIALILCREFMVTGLRTLGAQKGEVISADKLGKIKMMLQMVMLFTAGADWVGWINIKSGSPLRTYWIICISGVVIFTVLSGFSYFIKNRHLYMDMVKNNPSN